MPTTPQEQHNGQCHHPGRLPPSLPPAAQAQPAPLLQHAGGSQAHGSLQWRHTSPRTHPLPLCVWPVHTSCNKRPNTIAAAAREHTTRRATLPSQTHHSRVLLDGPPRQQKVKMQLVRRHRRLGQVPPLRRRRRPGRRPRRGRGPDRHLAEHDEKGRKRRRRKKARGRPRGTGTRGGPRRLQRGNDRGTQGGPWGLWATRCTRHLGGSVGGGRRQGR